VTLGGIRDHQAASGEPALEKNTAEKDMGRGSSPFKYIGLSKAIPSTSIPKELPKPQEREKGS